MEHMQATPNMPHIVQVYQHQPTVTNTKIHNPQIIHISHPSLQTSQGKVTYQQTITSETLHIPSTEHVTDMNLVMSCQQGLPSIQPSSVQSQVLQNDLSQPLQFTSVILPQVPVFKQHMLMDGQQYYGQYEAFLKEPHCIVTKVEPDLQAVAEKQIESKSEREPQKELEICSKKKRQRSTVPDPSKWACNIRKQKHQRGEAYINRRGKLVPEKHMKTTKNCLTSCKLKCNERINDTDREHIFKAFYSLSKNEKKHFLLNTTERNCIKNSKAPDSNGRKRYTFKYFFLVRAVRYTVCKKFYLGTLAISQKPIYNVHLSKSEMNIPKPDGRGFAGASAHTIASDIKDGVRKHIQSFKTEDSKGIKQFSRKKQYLDCSLSIKQMYTMYLNECEKGNVKPVKESMYRNIFKREYNLHCRKAKSDSLCGKCKTPIKKK